MYAVPLRASVAPHLSQTLFSSNATCVPQPVPMPLRQFIAFSSLRYELQTYHSLKSPVLVAFDHVASVIVNTDHCVVALELKPAEHCEIKARLVKFGEIE